MKISFVIPAYNEEAYLPLCLDAIVAEKNKGKYDMEIIVVNNASTDSTRQVALSYSGVKLVDEPKKGLSAARQAGYLASTGDLIANIDSDSVLTPGWIDTVLAHFSENPKLVALSGPFIYHDLNVFTNLLVRWQYVVDYCVYLINRFVLRVSSILQGGNFVIRKSFLDQIGGFNPEFTFWGEDTYIAKKLNPLGPVVFTFELPIYSSGRRLKKEGKFKIAYKYAMNFFWTVFFNKPFSSSYMDIRQPRAKQNNFQTTLFNFEEALSYAKISIVFVVFSLLGGTAYLWGQVVSNVSPTSVSASVISSDPYLVEKVHTSFAKIRTHIKSVEYDLNMK